MKLTVIDKEAFDQWKDRVIRELSKSDSPYLNEDRIGLFDYKKLDPLISKQNSREIEVLPTTSIEEVIDLFMTYNLITIIQRINQAGEDDTITYSIYCPSVSRGGLSLSKTLADYGIQENDLLLLNVKIDHPNVFSLGLVFLKTTRELTDYCDIIQSSEDIEHSLLTPSNNNTFSSIVESILLYTDEDTDLAQYLRYNYLALNEMTGHHLHIYTIEQVTQVKGVSTHEYWKATLNQTTHSFLHMMGWTRYKPYNKAEAYRIANMLGIYPDALPCVTIFGKHMNRNEKIVITISGEIKIFFRRLSSIILRTMAKYRDLHVEPFANFDEFKETFLSNWSTWTEEAGKKENWNTTFNFEGNTVFINKLSGDLELKDFQNN